MYKNSSPMAAARQAALALVQGGRGPSTAVAFLFPALSLSLPSGYSWGAVLLLLASLAGVRAWWGRALPWRARWLLATVAGMGWVWWLGTQQGAGWSHLDRSAKYLLVLPCMLYLLARPPCAVALRWGVAVGAVGAGGVALYQTQVLAWPRASGFTNAIQYGDLSLLLALMCALWLAAAWARLGRGARLALLLGALLGLLGSLLSHSRGGWLALLLGLPLWLWLLRARLAALLRPAVLGLVLLVLLVLGVLQGQTLAQRVHEAWREVQSYAHTGAADTSVGQRLEHWQLAWALGWERPLQGWGDAGYVAEKNRRAAAGQVHPALREFDHAHNEWLDMFAKRGLVGLGALCAFYVVPLWLFWPRRTLEPGSTEQALALVGLALPVSYLGFGLTQTFFAHNSGHVFYLFMLALCFAALASVQSPPCPRR